MSEILLPDDGRTLNYAMEPLKARKKGNRAESPPGWGSGTAILTGIEIEKKMNEMCHKMMTGESWARSSLGSAPQRARAQKVLSQLSSFPLPFLPAVMSPRRQNPLHCPLVICIKNIIHCNHKDLRKNACNEPLLRHKMQLPGKKDLGVR